MWNLTKSHENDPYRLSTRSCSVLLFVLGSLDHFKRTNDTFGHVAGDSVLRRTAHEISRMVRREELLARYAGGYEYGSID